MIVSNKTCLNEDPFFGSITINKAIFLALVSRNFYSFSNDLVMKGSLFISYVNWYGEGFAFKFNS